MNEVTLIGIDLGKQSLHLHAQDATGRMVFRSGSRASSYRGCWRTYPPVGAMEACAGPHWLARRLAGMGHEPRLISPQFVRPLSREE